MRLIIVVVLGDLMSDAALAQSASYTGQQTRDIKALASQGQADLLAGCGMGLARAGELNHYPGPAHAVEL